MPETPMNDVSRARSNRWLARWIPSALLLVAAAVMSCEALIGFRDPYGHFYDWLGVWMALILTLAAFGAASRWRLCRGLACAASWLIGIFWLLTMAVDSSPSVTIDRTVWLVGWALTIVTLTAAVLQLLRSETS